MKKLAAAAVFVGLATGVSAATCSVGTFSYTVTPASDSLCFEGNDAAYMASDPALFGQTGWVQADNSITGAGDGAVTFTNAPVWGPTGGPFSIDNPSGYSVAVSFQTYNKVGFFDLGSSLSDFDWTSSNTGDLFWASIWYIPTEVPLPAGGALLLTGLGAFAFLRRRART